MSKYIISRNAGANM